jgi:hypothetical protein
MLNKSAFTTSIGQHYTSISKQYLFKRRLSANGAPPTRDIALIIGFSAADRPDDNSNKGIDHVKEICVCSGHRGARHRSFAVASDACTTVRDGISHDRSCRQRMRPRLVSRAGRRVPSIWLRPIPRRLSRAIPQRLSLERLSSGLLAWTVGALPRYAVSRQAAGRRLEVVLRLAATAFLARKSK